MNKTQHILNRRPLLRWALATACGMSLAACGGGGGGGDPAPETAPAPPPVLANPTAITQGFWSGSAAGGPEGSTRASAVIMPDLTTWIAFESSTAVVGVAKAALTGTGTSATTASLAATGSYYTLGTTLPVRPAKEGATATGTVTTAGALNATGTVAGAATTFAWTPVAGYTNAATLGNTTGTFKGRLGGGAVVVTWVIDAAGNLAAGSNSTTGCVYTGTVKPNAGFIAVHDVGVNEDCAGTVRAFAGIATVKAAAGAVPASIRVIYTADAGASGGLLALDKQ